MASAAGGDEMAMTSPQEKRIALEAAEWVVKFDGVEFTAADVRAFRRWLAKSDAHRVAFEAASKTWNRLDLLSRLEAFPLASPEPVSVDRRALFAGAGAGVLGLGIAGYIALAADRAEAYETAVGEIREIRLSDGTVALLGAETRIEAHVSGNQRRVRVAAGEALFTIAASEGDPVSISTPSGGVDASQGQVLVKVLTDGARITLLSAPGQVWRAGLVARHRAVGADASSEIVFGEGNIRVIHVQPPLLSRRTLWREGRLAFDDTPLAEAVEDVARHTGARFAFGDPALRALRVGGLIEADNLEAFLALLRQNLAVDAERGADGVITLTSTATFEP